MQSTFDNHLGAWKTESETQLKRTTAWGLPVAIGTFCGGITIPSIIGNNFSAEQALIVWFPAVVMLLFWALHRWRKLPTLAVAYSIPWSMFLSSALQTATAEGAQNIMVTIFTNIPVFVASSLILFWRARHSLFALLFAIVAHILILGVWFQTPWQDNYSLYFVVLPIGIASVVLSQYRYTSTKKLFLVNESLQETNEELTASNDALETTQNELSKKNQSITDSIRYAQRIQSAILPDPDHLQKHLPQSFVFYRPKDIVSGDFYWFHQQDDVSLFAIVDCTGHGVPGAFMSLLGFNGLHTFAVEQGMTDPAAILTKLDRQVSDILRQNSSKQQLRDGMEMVLCAIRPADRSVTFASAHRPVFHVMDGQLHELKGSRFPIGDFQITNKVFENQSLTLAPGDTLYLSTDGYADQFGGPDQKKYYKKRFKQLLTSLHGLSMPEQGQLLAEEFDAWMGNHSQMDDVTVAGIQIPA